MTTGLLLNRLIYFYVSVLSYSEEAREQAEKTAHHVATTDSVTGLPNANLLREILEEEIEKTKSSPAIRESFTASIRATRPGGYYQVYPLENRS